jgi:hypothetical protein
MTMTRVRLARTIVFLAVGLLTVGCTAVTGGRAQAPPRSTARSLTGQTIRQALLDGGTLSSILKEPFIIDHRLPPRFGGPEALQDPRSAPPTDCLGAAEMLHQSVYQSSEVDYVAAETWRRAGVSAKLTDIKEGVVSLPTAADANKLFSIFTQQWQKCDGQALLLPDRVFRLRAKITDVHAAPTVLAGTVWIAFDSPSSDTLAMPAKRAIGVRGNCLVEVEADFFNESSRSPQGSVATDPTAVDISQIMMDRLGALS